MKKIIFTLLIITNIFANENPMMEGGKFLNFNYKMIRVVPPMIDFNEFDLSKEQTKELLFINYEFNDRAKKIDDDIKPFYMFNESFEKNKYIDDRVKNFTQITTLEADTFDKILKVLDNKQKTLLFTKLKNLDMNFKDKREKIDRFIDGRR